jgi:glucosamine kinase
MPEWVLGLDGGGTKTLLALANQNGDVLGPFIGAGVNPFDQTHWRNELETLLAQCPIKRDDLAFSSFGLPGYGESAVINAQQFEVVQNFARENSVVLNDVAVAFAGALAGKLGVLILAGTGSMAWAGNGAREIRVGGFGDGFGDEGSGYWIGQQALQKLSWTLDGRLEDDRFRDSMLEAIGVSDAEGLISWFYGLEHQTGPTGRCGQPDRNRHFARSCQSACRSRKNGMAKTRIAIRLEHQLCGQCFQITHNS